MFPHNFFRLYWVLVLTTLLISIAVGAPYRSPETQDLVKSIRKGPAARTLDEDYTQLRYVKTTDYGQTWTPIQQAGDLAALAATESSIGDMSAIVTGDDQLLFAVPLPSALCATPGVYAFKGPNFTPVMIMPEGTNRFTPGSNGANGYGWADIGRCPNGTLLCIIWGITAANAHTIWAVKSTDNGGSWGTPWVIATEPAIRDSCYPHIADMNHNDYGFVVFQKMTALGRQQYILKFSTATGAAEIYDTGRLSPTNANQPSYYIGACKPIAYDPAGGPQGALYCVSRNTNASGVGISYSGNMGQTFVNAEIIYAQRYPAVNLRVADQKPWVTSNRGVPASAGLFHVAWSAYDDFGYNGGSWTAPDTAFGVAPAPYDGTRPLLYVNQAYFWDANRGVGMYNVWGQFTPEELYTSYTADGGTSWTGFSRRWGFLSDNLDAGTLSQNELIGGPNGVAYIVCYGMTGSTDLTPPVLYNMTLRTPATSLGPWVVSCDVQENQSVSAENVWFNYRHPPVDGADYNVVGMDSVMLVDTLTGSGTYYFTLPNVHSNDSTVHQGDTIWFFCDAQDDYLNYGSVMFEQYLVAGVVWQDADSRSSVTPAEFALYSNYPNPFNATTRIYFDLPESADISLKVFNTIGQEVAVLADGKRLGAGQHAVTFDASALPTGVYFYTLTANGRTATQKMILLK